ncbi:MAG: GNAT family N-acetyltransferase [Thermomicrobiales bacterium]
MSDPVVPGSSSLQPLDLARHDEAAELLAACADIGTVDAGRNRLTESGNDPKASIYGITDGGQLVAVYILRKIELANELTAIAVREDRRRQGVGRACLQDALRRSGRRPLTVEADDDTLAFYKACGFKLVGRRKQPDGTMRYRLGWHMPGLRRPIADREG